MPTTSPARLPTCEPANVQTCQRANVRKRGAPRGNTNALTHGAYSSRNLTPLSTIMLTLASLRRQFKTSPAAPPPDSIKATQDAFWQLTACCDPHAPLSIRLDQFTRIGQTSAFLWRQRMRQYHFTCDLHDLEIIAPRALDIIHVDFRDHGITRDADLPWWFSPGSSFPTDPELTSFTERRLDHKSNDYKTRFITDAQWKAIELLIPPSQATTSRGRPPADPRRLLDAIFIKLATGCRWEDLPRGLPPLLTCRRYYRRLYLSGRLTTLYNHLFEHLQEHGASLPDLVKQGCFMARSHHQLTLKPGIPATWQNRTALLFLQLALHTLRRRRREYHQRRSTMCPPRTLAAFQKRQADLAHSLAIYNRDRTHTIIPHLQPLDLSNLGPRSPRSTPCRPSANQQPATASPVGINNNVPCWDPQSSDLQPSTFTSLTELFLKSSNKSDLNSSKPSPADATTN